MIWGIHFSHNPCQAVIVIVDKIIHVRVILESVLIHNSSRVSHQISLNDFTLASGLNILRPGKEKAGFCGENKNEWQQSAGFLDQLFSLDRDIDPKNREV